MTGLFNEVKKHADTHPAEFWAAAAEDVSWIKPATTILDDAKPPFYRWFVGGEINGCYNAVDCHVEAGHGDRTAIIYDGAIIGIKEYISYAELQDRVARCADVLLQNGITYGDRVIIYMPMIPQALVAMLACARIGAVHSVVFGGFAAAELAKRIDDATPKMIVTASCGLEPGRVVEYKPLIDDAIELSAHKIDNVLLYQREMCKAAMIDGRDMDWDEALAAAGHAACVPVKSEDPAYILIYIWDHRNAKGRGAANGWAYCRLEMVNAEYFQAAGRAMSIGRHLMWVGWLVILTLSMHLYLRAAQRFCLKANRLAHQMRLRSGG